MSRLKRELSGGLSASETRALCTRAARGAGHEWGVAQEAGQAAARLVALGLAGPSLLSALLRATGDAPQTANRPDPELSRWTEPGRPLCSLATGCLVSDLGAELFVLREVTFGPVRVPALLAGFVQPQDIEAGLGMSVLWPEGELWVAPSGDPAPALLGTGEIAAELAAEVTLCPAQRPPHLGPAPARPTTEVDIAFLERLAARTYVPESERSRTSGAGEGA